MLEERGVVPVRKREAVKKREQSSEEKKNNDGEQDSGRARRTEVRTSEDEYPRTSS